MKRLGAGLVLLLAGCLTYPATRVGQPPSDHASEVEAALDAVALKSIERHVRGDGWVPHRSVHGSGGTSRESRWHSHFACQTPGEFPVTKVWRLPEADYARVLTPIRADVLAAVRGCGVEVLTATDVERTPGRARFEVLFSCRGGEAAGVVEGVIGQGIEVGGDVGEYTDVVVKLREWYTR